MNDALPYVTTYPVDCGKHPLLDLDADEYGNFIAFNAEKVWTNSRQLPVPQRFQHPIVRELTQELFLVVEARQRQAANGHIFDWSGYKHVSFEAGDAVADVLIQANQIVVSYFDEGIGAGRPSADGLAVFDFTGQQLFGFNSSQPEFIMDCYAMCKSGNDSLLAYTYTDFPLFEIRLGDFRVTQQPTPADFQGAHALTTSYGNVVLYSSYQDKSSFLWWNRKDKTRQFGHYGPAPLRGIGAGKFLTFDANSFTVIDAMQMMQAEAEK